LVNLNTKERSRPPGDFFSPLGLLDVFTFHPYWPSRFFYRRFSTVLLSLPAAFAGMRRITSLCGFRAVSPPSCPTDLREHSQCSASCSRPRVTIGTAFARWLRRCLPPFGFRQEHEHGRPSLLPAEKNSEASSKSSFPPLLVTDWISFVAFL